MNFDKITSFPIRNRAHKYAVSMEGSLPDGDMFADLYDALPDVLAVRDLKTTARAIAQASAANREVILAMGAHPVKCGLSGVIIGMMEREIITCVAMNGAGAIHDFEIAYLGETSEDVAQTLRDGSFGMVEETPRILNQAMATGVANSLGAGAAIGRHILNGGYGHAGHSILAAGYRLGIDVTLHIAIGTDTIHVHPSADGAVLGKASHTDLTRLADHVAHLDEGVYINLGSAVLLPEVFLKVLSAVRNMGNDVRTFTTVNMDMIRHYRPSENVLKRPSLTGATAINLTGHHEIMLPLLFSAVTLERERMA